MRVYFLESSDGIPATKTIHANGEKSNFNNLYRLTSHEHEISTPKEFFEVIQSHAQAQHCLLKGELTRPLRAESRASSTEPQGLTQWICLDLDNVEGMTDPDQFILSVLPKEFHDVSYIWQASSSQGFKPGLNGHIFMMLSQRVSAPLLKEFLADLNHTNETLKNQLALTKTGFALSYKLDITTCQNDKLLYIAPPVFVGLEDPVPNRIQFRDRANDLVTFTFQHKNTHETAQGLVAQLRKEAGLPKRTASFKTSGKIQYLANPHRAHVTGPTKHERGFVYLNINGGDSFAYYYPENDPTYLFNFKGEPIVQLKDFVPDYYQSLVPGDTKAIVFREPETDQYYNGTWNGQELKLYPAKNKERLADFLAQYQQELPDPIPDWEYTFDPTNFTRVDFDKRFANRWEPTGFLENYKNAALPPIARKVIESVTGNDKESTEHFINWLAFVVQTRRKTGTAWMMHGVEGTGKGLLFHNILVPILGINYCKIINLDDLSDNFNEWLETCLILFVDEVRLDSSQKSKLNRLKSLITEPVGRIRRMRANPYQVKLYNNIIMASNSEDAMYISETDRRFNVARRQTKRLIITQEEIEHLQFELPAVTGFLMNYKYDPRKVNTPLVNDAKEQMKRASQNSSEQFFAALREGNLDFFLELGSLAPTPQHMLKAAACRDTLTRWVGNLGQPIIITIDEIRSVYDYIQGQSEKHSPNVFRRLLDHNQVPTDTVELDGRMVKGTTVIFHASENAINMFRDNHNVVSMQ